MTGYYRVNYEAKNWQRIANYLDSDNYTKIHVLNRAQIIDDAFHLMITRQLNASIFWDLIKYLSRETDYVAWYPMFKALEYMSSIFPLKEQIVYDIKVGISQLFYLLKICRCIKFISSIYKIFYIIQQTIQQIILRHLTLETSSDALLIIR